MAIYLFDLQHAKRPLDKIGLMELFPLCLYCRVLLWLNYDSDTHFIFITMNGGKLARFMWTFSNLSVNSGWNLTTFIIWQKLLWEEPYTDIRVLKVSCKTNSNMIWYLSDPLELKLSWSLCKVTLILSIMAIVENIDVRHTLSDQNCY